MNVTYRTYVGTFDPPGIPSLPLDGRRRLPRDVVHHARDALHFIHDAPRAYVEEVIRQPRPVRGHEVDGLDGAQAHHVVVAAPITHHTHASHRQEHRERLRSLVIQIMPAQLFDEDVVRLAQEIRVVLAYFAEDAHTQTRAREWMAIDHLARQPELDTQLAHLVLEQLAQRLHQLHAHVRRQPTHVVVRLDHVGLAGLGTRGLDDVGVDSALSEEVHALELVRLLVEHLDELGADDLALALGIVLAAQRVEEALLGIHADDLDAEVLGENLHDGVAFMQTQQAMVDEHADQ